MQVETLLNEIVVHRLYGEGIIEAVDGNRITVVFEDTKKCTFLVPSCFDKFLRLKGDDKQDEIDEALMQWKTENAVFKSEELQKKMKNRQEGIDQRGREREKRKLEKAIEESKRIRFFAGLDAPEKDKKTPQK